ncbi:ABC transporter permease [Oceanobacillus chungangensis]|uniref:ABC transporter permease n=1 Tax=Oceanobacillus chungangensis TaxID=1229152 RepID=A0A3D8PY22_9BACI|nr:ABC transporter permease [Oceanobacillus chungangensis]RDW20437.1 ABC transporter permease [Oceanobacillus chungangensis]
MRNSRKVAKWEIKRNLKNKSYIIGLFLTPLLMILGFTLPGLFSSDEDNSELTQVYIHDELNLYTDIESIADEIGLNWQLNQTDLSEAEATSALEDSENTAYLFLTEQVLTDGVVPVYTSEEIDNAFMNEVQLLTTPLQTLQLEQLGLSPEQLAVVSNGVVFEEVSTEESEAETGEAGLETASSDDFLEKMVPGAFAGIIFISIVFTGMAIFQSASQEKKDKIAEIILSSITPTELMQGKIIGYFILGLIQVAVLLVFLVPLVIWKFDMPIMEYLLVPETLLLTFIALLGYLLFAAVFVGIGATMSDMTTAGNFQGFTMMLPFLPFAFIGPVIGNPSGIIAQIGTYIPFSSPGVMILRISLLEEWPWLEIIIGLVILLISIWLCMKLAGKIFKVGILMYGKNASPAEIWKWIRA